MAHTESIRCCEELIAASEDGRMCYAHGNVWYVVDKDRKTVVSYEMLSSPPQVTRFDAEKSAAYIAENPPRNFGPGMVETLRGLIKHFS